MEKMARKIFFSHNYFFWLLLTIPSLVMLLSIFRGTDLAELLELTGEFAARLLIVTMAITPLRKIFPKIKFVKWLIKHRRHLGVASFAYALLHTVFYLFTLSRLDEFFTDFLILGIWTGWIAFFIFVPLAVTSNDSSVKFLKKKWKKIHRLVYLAALFTLIHWLFIHGQILAALLNFLPLFFLELYRVKLYLINFKQKTRNEV